MSVMRQGREGIVRGARADLLRVVGDFSNGLLDGTLDLISDRRLGVRRSSSRDTSSSASGSVVSNRGG